MKKVLILTANTGHGHIAAARTMLDILLERKVECELKDTLSFVGKKTAELIANAIVNIAVKRPAPFGGPKSRTKNAGCAKTVYQSQCK